MQATQTICVCECTCNSYKHDNVAKAPHYSWFAYWRTTVYRRRPLPAMRGTPMHINIYYMKSFHLRTALVCKRRAHTSTASYLPVREQICTWSCLPVGESFGCVVPFYVIAKGDGINTNYFTANVRNMQYVIIAECIYYYTLVLYQLCPEKLACRNYDLLQNFGSTSPQLIFKQCFTNQCVPAVLVLTERIT